MWRQGIRAGRPWDAVRPRCTPSQWVDGVGSVEKTIEALPAPEKLTIEDRDSVANAKAMYEALEQADRETVSETLREKLTGATERMAVLEKIDNAREQIRKLRRRRTPGTAM